MHASATKGFSNPFIAYASPNGLGGEAVALHVRIDANTMPGHTEESSTVAEHASTPGYPF